MTGLGAPSGNVLFQNWDETPLWEDELEGEETAVERGSKAVAVNVSHQASRNKFSTVLTIASISGLPTPPAAVIFKVPSGGVQVAKKLKKDLIGLPSEKMKFLITSSGNTTSDIMPELHTLQEDWPPPLIRTMVTKEAGGWRVSLFDSYEAHKSWVRDHYKELLRKRIFPLIIPGGLTGDVQPCDTSVNKVQQPGHTSCPLLLPSCHRCSKRTPRSFNNNGNWII